MATLLPYGSKRDESLLAELESQEQVAGDRAGNLNAQSVQVSYTGVEESYQIEESQLWSYDYSGKPAAEAAYATCFTMTIPGNAKHDAMKESKCCLWHGTALQTQVSAKNTGPVSGPYPITSTPVAPGIYPA